MGSIQSVFLQYCSTADCFYVATTYISLIFSSYIFTTIGLLSFMVGPTQTKRRGGLILSKSNPKFRRLQTNSNTVTTSDLIYKMLRGTRFCGMLPGMQHSHKSCPIILIKLIKLRCGSCREYYPKYLQRTLLQFLNFAPEARKRKPNQNETR